MKLLPLGDRVIVKAVAKEEMTKTGIILPGANEKERPEQGEIVAVGPGRLMDTGTRSPVSVSVGDKVVFKKYAPDEVKIGDETYLVLSESDIMAVIQN